MVPAKAPDEIKARQMVEDTERLEAHEEHLQDVAEQLIRDLEYFIRSGYADEVEKGKKKAAAIEHQLKSSTQIEERDAQRILHLLSGVLTFNFHVKRASDEAKILIVKLREQEHLLDKAERLIEKIPTARPDYVAGFLQNLRAEMQVTRRILHEEDRELAA